MVVRYAIANITARELALWGQSHGIAGSVSEGFGFGDWGIEPTAFLEVSTGDADYLDALVVALLAARNEQAAYRTVDGASASLLWSDHRLEAIAA